MIPYRLPLVLICILLSLPIFSQAYFGLKGGINQSKSTFIFNVDPALITNKGDLYGFYFSVPAEVRLNEFINLMPELALISEGSVLSVQVQEEQRTYNNAIFYAKLPILAKVKLLKKKYYEFGVVGGIVPAYAIGVKSFYFTSFDLRKSIDVPVDFSDAGIRRFDLAFSVGLNTEKVIAQGWKIILDVRYNLGLLDVETHSNLTNTTEGLNLTIGILTPLFKKQEVF